MDITSQPDLHNSTSSAAALIPGIDLAVEDVDYRSEQAKFEACSEGVFSFGAGAYVSSECGGRPDFRTWDDDIKGDRCPGFADASRRGLGDSLVDRGSDVPTSLYGPIHLSDVISFGRCAHRTIHVEQKLGGMHAGKVVVDSQGGSSSEEDMDQR